MKRLICLVVFLFMISFGNLSFGSTLDTAVREIRKIDNLVNTGVTYKMYVSSLPDMTLAIEDYAESKGSDKKIVALMKDISTNYEKAARIWELYLHTIIGNSLLDPKFGCDQRNAPLCNLIKEWYPDLESENSLSINKVLSHIWGKAEVKVRELRAASKKYGGQNDGSR